MRLSRQTLGLILLAVLAIGLRMALVLALSGEHSRPLAYEHGRIAENLLAGRGFSIEFLGVAGLTSQQAPFYPVLLAAVYGLLGVNTPGAILAVQLLQCVAGTILVLAIVGLAWQLNDDRRVGWVAGLAAAMYPPHVYMVTHLQVALWAALLLAVLLWVATTRWHSMLWQATVLGVLSALLLLVEPILALTLPIAAATLAVRWLAADRPWPLASAIQPVALAAVVAAAVIAPWTIRNRCIHGEWIFIKSSFGYAFWQGNHPLSWGTDKIPKPSAEMMRLQHDGSLRGIDRALWEARHETLYIDDVLLKPEGYQRFAGLTEPQRSRLLGNEAWASLWADPLHYLRLCRQRLRYFLLWDETNPKAANPLYRISTLAWLLLGGTGLIVSLPDWRRMWPTYAVFAAVCLFHTLVIVSARFRIPVEPLGWIWAGYVVLLPQRVAFRQPLWASQVRGSQATAMP